MKLIRFRRLSRPPKLIVWEGEQVLATYWEIAFDTDDLNRKLNGELAEVIMPPAAWPVRLWRRFFPLKGAEKDSKEVAR